MSVYHLRVRVDEGRKPTASALLFSLAQQVLRGEKRGEAVEQVHCHLTGDGDYSAVVLVYPAPDGPALSGTNGTDVAEDDITVADEVKNGAEREAAEAERLQGIELQKQLDAYALRRQAAGHDD